MKTITATTMCSRIGAMLLTMVLASHVALSQEVPFRGKVQQDETQIINFPDMSVEGTGTGNATQLGRFIVTFEHQVDLLTGLGTGSAQFIGSHGNRIFTELAALGVPTHVPGVFVVMERHIILGGTGRFEDATGSFVLVRYINFGLSTASHGTFEGTIILANKK